MRKIIVILALVGASFAASAEWVDGYTRKDGTYVQGHNRASSNSYRYDNPSSRSMGGTHRDEFSNPGATNRSNSGYGSYDNDGDGLSNSYDPRPESKCNYSYGC